MLDFTLPIPDNSVDKIFAWSVFTHMYEVDIRYYLQEFKRILKSDGAVFATCFIITPEILGRARETNLTKFDLRFETEIEPGCYINNPDFPLGAIGNSPDRIRSMIVESQLTLARDFVRGAWSGFYPDPEDGQDAFILKPHDQAS